MSYFKSNFHKKIINKKINKNINKNINPTTFPMTPLVKYINKSLNPIHYSGLFKSMGIVSIPNFLDTTFADKVFHFINQEMTAEWWYFTGFYNDNKIILPDTIENQSKIQEVKEKCQSDFNNDKFSYHFYRTYNDHFPECDCPECTLRMTITSPEFTNLISQITGIKLTKNNELFISKYSEGSYLTTHNDNGNGKIAFVINLTKNWKPQYGGNFCLLKEDRLSIKKIITPTFNSCTIFRIPDNKGIPHYVSHVVSGVKYNRYAVSGWFS